jgi:NADPH:quinone reductase-like Zn-dependent oxidoreductase
MATMKAVTIHRFGGPEVLQVEDVPMPVPAAGELLVKIRAASVNPIDYKIRQGGFLGEDKLPLTLGRDISGTVTEGSAGGYRRDDPVFALLPPGRGGYAQFVAVPADLVAVKPARLSHPQAAAVPLVAMTAWQGLFDHGQLQAGQRVLIHGGAGGVGHMAVQFAKVRGAFVYATVGGRDLGFMQELGVDRPIDYTAERFEQVATDLDLVFDLIAGEVQERSLALIKRGGRLVSTLTEPPQERCAELGITGMRYMAQPNGKQLAEIARLLDEGKVRVEVAQTFPLDQVRAAQERLEQGGVRGKLVLEVA